MHAVVIAASLLQLALMPLASGNASGETAAFRDKQPSIASPHIA